jgi:hypothetical protein
VSNKDLDVFIRGNEKEKIQEATNQIHHSWYFPITMHPCGEIPTPGGGDDNKRESINLTFEESDSSLELLFLGTSPLFPLFAIFSHKSEHCNATHHLLSGEVKLCASLGCSFYVG